MRQPQVTRAVVQRRDARRRVEPQIRPGGERPLGWSASQGWAAHAAATQASNAARAASIGSPSRTPNRPSATSWSDDVLLHVAAAGTADLQDVLRALPRIGARRATTMLRLGPVKEQSPTPLGPSATSGATRR